MNNNLASRVSAFLNDENAPTEAKEQLSQVLGEMSGLIGNEDYKNFPELVNALVNHPHAGLYEKHLIKDLPIMTEQNNTNTETTTATNKKWTYEETLKNLKIEPVRFGYRLHEYFQSPKTSDDAAEIVQGLVNYGADIVSGALFLDYDVMREGFPPLVEAVRAKHGDKTALEYLRTIETALFHHSFENPELFTALINHALEIHEHAKNLLPYNAVTAFEKTMRDAFAESVNEEEKPEAQPEEVITKGQARFDRDVKPLLGLPLSVLLAAVCNHEDTWTNLTDVIWNECHEQSDHEACTVEDFENVLRNNPVKEKPLDLSAHSTPEGEPINLAKHLSAVINNPNTPVKISNCIKEGLTDLTESAYVGDSPEYIQEVLNHIEDGQKRQFPESLSNSPYSATGIGFIDADKAEETAPKND